MFRTITTSEDLNYYNSGQDVNQYTGTLNEHLTRTTLAYDTHVMETPSPLSKPSQISVELTHESSTNLYKGFNPWASGLFVDTWEILPLGTLVQIKLRLAGIPKEFPIFGRVAFVKEENELSLDLPPGIGIEFVYVDQSIANLLAKFASEREPIFFE